MRALLTIALLLVAAAPAPVTARPPNAATILQRMKAALEPARPSASSP